MTDRVRVAAVIQREDRILMVRERVQTGPGRHDGPEYWTLPGGGIEPDEEAAVAVRREVLEEVGLEVVAAREVARVPYPSGTTTVFRVEVSGGEPRLGVDEDNAVIESWHSTVEFELRTLEHFTTRAQARTRVAAWIEEYNHDRRHSALGMRSPITYELTHQAHDHEPEQAA